MNSSHSIYMSIIIPAFNEEKRIPATLEKIDLFLKQQKFSSEVVVVNDCSTDKTKEMVETFAKTHPSVRIISGAINQGKGAAVKKGMLSAQGENRLFTDADLSTPIETVLSMIPFLKVHGDSNDQNKDKFDVVIGSRRVAGAQLPVRQPIFREAAGRVFSVLVRLITLRGFIDTQCGFKLFTRPAAEEIFRRQQIFDFGFDVDILFIAQSVLGLKIKEAPVTWADSPFSRVRVWRDSVRMFIDLILIRLYHARRRYDL